VGVCERECGCCMVFWWRGVDGLEGRRRGGGGGCGGIFSGCDWVWW